MIENNVYALNLWNKDINGLFLSTYIMNYHAILYLMGV